VSWLVRIRDLDQYLEKMIPFLRLANKYKPSCAQRYERLHILKD
jgi:hypothetical protein